MIRILKKLAVILVAALIVFLLFYNCSSPKKDEGSAEVQKETNTAASPYTTDCKTLYNNAVQMDSVIMNSVELNKEVGNKAIKVFSDFSFYCKEDSLAPVFLIKASQIAQSINNLPQAQLCLEKCISDFPRFKNRGAAMFLLAQLYDEPRYLNNEEKAIELYKQIMSDYPRTEWAANAAAAKELVGKTDEQIIEAFNKRNSK